VLSVAQIGNELRVLVEPGGDAAQLRSQLRASAIDAEVTAIEPNLEDVFVSATHRLGEVKAA
jgi:ABC-2 type transport system ATP-binding protein